MPRRALRDPDPVIAARIDEKAGELVALVQMAQHHTRLRIILYAALVERERFSPVEMALDLGEPLGTLAYHVRKLKAMHLVKLAGTRPVRGAVEHYYSLTKQGRVMADRILALSA